MWMKSENSEPILPDKIEVMGNYVAVRRNIKFVKANEEIAAHYEWEEWQMTKEQYEIYRYFNENLTKEDDMISNINMASGQFFMIGNRLFVSIVAIVSGEKIIPGLNCTELSFADALNQLNI